MSAMSAQLKILIGIAVVLFLFLLGKFIYYNIIIPEPYREELRVCLLEARTLENVEKIEKAESACFRTYPHFN